MKLKEIIIENENYSIQKIQILMQEWKKNYPQESKNNQVLELGTFLTSVLTWANGNNSSTKNLAQLISPNQRKWLTHFYAGTLRQPHINLQPKFSCMEKLHLRLNSARNFRSKAEENEDTLQTQDLITIWKTSKMRLKITGMDSWDAQILLKR